MKIFNKNLSEEIVNKIISKVKEKKELSNIENSYVKNILRKELAKNTKLVDFLKEHELKTLNRSSKYKELIKKIRAHLRRVYGVFVAESSEKREKLLEKLTNTQGNRKEIHKKLLETHLSTKERVPHYKKIYQKIWEFTKKPKIILDLGCGLNPLSFPWMNLNRVDYLAVELNKKDCEFLNRYFKIIKDSGLHGNAKAIDLTNEIKKIESLPKSDVCFMLKILDTIEEGQKGHKRSEELIKKAPCRFIVASFPTATISQKEMPGSKNKRAWLEKLCERLKFDFKKFEVSNELFYIIDKKED